MVQNGVKEDHKEPPSDGRARQQSGREGGGGDDGEVEQEPSQSAPDWDSIPATEPPKHKTSGDHLEYMAGNLVDSLVNEPEEVRTRIKYAFIINVDYIRSPSLLLQQLVRRRYQGLLPRRQLNPR